MARRLLLALPAGLPFDVTLLFTEDTVCAAFERERLPARFALALVPAVSHVAFGASVSGVDTAIERRHRVAVSGRPAPRTIFDDPSAPDASYLNLTAMMVHDVNRWESFNLNPRENHGHQLDALLGWDDGTNNAAMLAVNYGFSGAITTDVPGLHAALAADAVH
jgi:hypothetical protein